ncbi:hypothetical protein LTS18_006236 [Coniosporium uncinatum]|uniref:Uncharacterized protein n=1 Tax=Coniosporium uncinatum TaxID=93489 RepID=A0ACC3DZ38_9PEZI|nr:hypothetical protein LTS18_006236 [Coniosporium uncinatum]
MASQQLSGINVFAFLAATILNDIGRGAAPLNSLLMAFGFAAANAIFSPLAYWALDATAAVLVWLFVPGTTETTSLEQMIYVYRVSLRRHLLYQLTEVLPWVRGRLMPGVSTKSPKSLYRWNTTKSWRTAQENVRGPFNVEDRAQHMEEL